MRYAAAFAMVYLPLSALLGLLTGAFQAPGLPRDVGYELFLWFVVAVQLLLPTVAVYCPVILGLAALGAARRAAVLTISATLPTAQALAWGGHGLSAEWAVVAVVPAALLGAVSPPIRRKRTNS